MPLPSNQDPILRYLARQAFLSSPGENELPEPAAGLKLYVVIPALAEYERLPAVLASLNVGSHRLEESEVIVVVNQAANSQPEIVNNNQKTWQWLQTRTKSQLPVYGLDYASPGNELAADRAGVGLARRLGMDAALRRLQRAGSVRQAAIACLDADSPVAPGYIDALLDVFARDDAPFAGVCAYEHPLPADPSLAGPMCAYELWLRYYEAGLRLTGSPFAFPTIGSCTVASALGYALADGMPPRQAGEDFHFLRKLAKAGRERPVAHIQTASVFPAARISHRVPFGTGRAMRRCLEEGIECYTRVEPPAAFFDLQRFFAALETGVSEETRLKADAGPILSAFLDAERAWPVLAKIQRTVPFDQFLLAAHHWFDSLRIVRYVNHYARQNGRANILTAIGEIFRGLGVQDCLSDLPDPKDTGLAVLRIWLHRLREYASRQSVFI